MQVSLYEGYILARCDYLQTIYRYYRIEISIILTLKYFNFYRKKSGLFKMVADRSVLYFS